MLDNVSIHRPKRDLWPRHHPDVHFAPTRASWLNQIEIWFPILTSQSLQGSSFSSVRELVTRIDNFITL